MNWDQVKGNWKEVKGKVKERWGQLTNDDVEIIKGRREQLAGKVQQRYGIAREEAERQIADFLVSLDDQFISTTRKGGKI